MLFYKWHHSDQCVCSCPWALTHRQIFSPFLSPLFRRRNTQTWSYREEPTTLVSIYAFAVWRLDVTVRRCWRNWKQTLNTSLNSVIMEDTAVFVVVLQLGIVLSKLRKPEPPAGGPKQICLLIWEIVFKLSKTSCWRENRCVDAVAEHVEAGHLLWSRSRLKLQQHQHLIILYNTHFTINWSNYKL